MIPTFVQRQQQWSSPPVDDVGYLPASELLAWDAKDLREVIDRMEYTRYQGWRNWRGRWRNVLGLDSTHDKHVLDYGCGTGMEALQYAKANNTVSIADISDSNLHLATRVLRLYGYDPDGVYPIRSRKPYIFTFGGYDVIHCCGVLHHIPNPTPVVKEMASWLLPGGELRLMVYSADAWRIATGTEPPERVEDSPHFKLYWQHWDAVGGYADWYDEQRLQDRFGEWFTIERCVPLTQHGEYLGAVLVKR